MNLKAYAGIFIASLLVLLLMNISVGLLQKTDRVGKLNRNANHRYLVSVIHDQDLNLNNQTASPDNWLSSKTGNYPDLHSWGGVVAWVPFYAYVAVLANARLTNFNCIVDQVDFAQALAAIFCFILVLVNIYKIQKLINENSNSSLWLALFFLGTPAFWYVLIEPSGSIIFYLAVLSSIVFLIFNLILKKYKQHIWFIVGALSFILATINNRGYFVLIAMALFITLLKLKKLISSRDCFYYFAGIALVLGLEALNLRLKLGQVFTIFNFIGNDIYKIVPRKFMIFDSLFSTKGVVLMFPTYLAGILGLLIFCYEGWITKKIKTIESRLVFSTFLSAVISYFVSLYYWFHERDFIGAGFLEKQLIFAIGLGYLLKRIKKKIYIYIFLLASSAWSLFILAGYYVDRDLSIPRINADNLIRLYGVVIPDLTAIAPHNNMNTFLHSIYWLPVIFFILFGLYKVVFNEAKWKPLIGRVSIYVILCFVCISLLNIYINFQAQPGLLNQKKEVVISADLKVFSYNDFVGFLQKDYMAAIKDRRTALAKEITYKKTQHMQEVLADIKEMPAVTDNKIINRQKYLCELNSVERLN